MCCLALTSSGQQHTPLFSIYNHLNQQTMILEYASVESLSFKCNPMQLAYSKWHTTEQGFNLIIEASRCHLPLQTECNTVEKTLSIQLIMYLQSPKGYQTGKKQQVSLHANG